MSDDRVSVFFDSVLSKTDGRGIPSDHRKLRRKDYVELDHFEAVRFSTDFESSLISAAPTVIIISISSSLEPNSSREVIIFLANEIYELP